MAFTSCIMGYAYVYAYTLAIEHLLVECLNVQEIWREVFTFSLNCKYVKQSELRENYEASTIMFNTMNDDPKRNLNFIDMDLPTKMFGFKVIIKRCHQIHRRFELYNAKMNGTTAKL